MLHNLLLSTFLGVAILACTKQGDDPYISGHQIACCPGTQKLLCNFDNDGRYYYRCFPSGCTCGNADSGSCGGNNPSSCTGENDDPWASGHLIPCCSGLDKKLDNWDGDGRMYYKCVSNGPSPVPRPSRTPRPGPPTPAPPPTNCEMPPKGRGYYNNYDCRNRAYGIDLPSGDVYKNSFVFLIADHGLATSASHHGSCCQTQIADLMRKKKSEMERQGKKLIFIGAGGDNFYWTGLKDKNAGGSDQWERWKNVYRDMTNVPWFGIFGNHDFGDSDVHATCPDKSPKKRVNGQNYASNQLDADKGGYRNPYDDSKNFHIPDFNYRVQINELNFELFGLDHNTHDAGGIGGDSSGRGNVLRTCGGQGALNNRLQELYNSGIDMMKFYAGKNAHDTNSKRNVLIMQHYDGQHCTHRRDEFMGASPQKNIDVRCMFGHTHSSTVCEKWAPSGGCACPMLGGTGGCCSGHPVEKGSAGFGILTFDKNKGMNIEMVKLGHGCNLWPSNAQNDPNFKNWTQPFDFEQVPTFFNLNETMPDYLRANLRNPKYEF